MAYTPKRLAAATMTTTTTTNLGTVPTGKSWVVKQVLVSAGATAATLTLKLGPTTIAQAVPIAANSVETFDLSQVLAAAETITGGASAASTLQVMISGIEFP